MPLITDPIDLLLDAAGDIVVDGDVQWSTGVEAVAQGIRIALSTFRGEWFLDLDRGIPYLPNDDVPESAAILGQKFNEAKARVAVRDAILGVAGVLRLVSLVVGFDGATRALSVSWVVRTVYGETAGSLEI